jgi:hypothetical protein
MTKKQVTSVGDAMERAEVEATERMARECREPADYALFGLMGREAVRAARGMTQDQRAVFVARLAEAITQVAESSKIQGRGRLQHHLDFAARGQFDTGFDDEDR